MSSHSYRRIWKTIAEIPYGRVATYGQIAELAGLGKRARMVGYALHASPEDMALPWHRVINAQGRISFPAGSESYRRQRQRLQSEDISVIGGRIDLRRYRWRPADPELPDEYLNPNPEDYEFETDD